MAPDDGKDAATVKGRGLAVTPSGQTLATTGGDVVGAVASSGGEGLASGTKVGRFVVLARVGAGGMGEVYSAYDPELDRRVAIKLLRPDVAGGGEVAEARLRREARTMARIVDRNLVTVHDVGVHDARVFVAMEFVDGGTLRTWCEGKPWEAILAAYLEAGRGLAAAHAAGIVHRDFKPDNVMVSRDGRVAVTDFGIARTPGSIDPDEPGEIDDIRLTTTGAIIGTPRYMAPEQLDGAVADVRCDQFSFCVALWEALYGEHPFAPAGCGFPALREAVLRGELRAPPPSKMSSKVSPRVKQALARGLALDPAQRWPTFGELLGALDVLAPSRRWVWITLAAAGVVAAGSIAYGMWQAQNRVEDPGARCSGSEALLRGVWDEPRQGQVKQAFLATALPYAEVEYNLVRVRFDEWGQRWVDARTHACRATRAFHEQSYAALDAEMRCFDAQRTAARALVDVFSAADVDEVSNAAWALGRLPRPERCNDPAALAVLPPPSDPVRARMVDELEDRAATAKAMIEAGDYPSALIVLGPASIAARLAAYAPIEAKIEMEIGEAHMALGESAPAREHLERSVHLADEAKDDVSRGDASLLLATAAYYDSRYDDARHWLDTADGVARRIGADDELRAAVLQMRGEVDVETGDLARAIGELEEALQINRRSPPQIATAEMYSALAEAEAANGAPNLAMIDHKKALEAAKEVVGEGHPLTAKLLINYGAFLLRNDKVDEALPMFQRALAIKESVLGSDDPSLGFPLENIAVVLRRKGHFTEAEVDYQRALALFEKQPADAYAIPAALGGLALVRMQLGRDAEAVPLLARAVALRARAPQDVDDGENQFHLAIAMWRVGTDRAGAREHAFAARQIFKDRGDNAKKHLAEVERWLRDPDRYVPSFESAF